MKRVYLRLINNKQCQTTIDLAIINTSGMRKLRCVFDQQHISCDSTIFFFNLHNTTGMMNVHLILIALKDALIVAVGISLITAYV